MEAQQITNYLFISILVGASVYLLISLSLFIVKTKRIKTISIYSTIASVVYILGVIFIYLLETKNEKFIIALLLYWLKFVLETKMANKLSYSNKKYLPYHITIILTILLTYLSIVVGIRDINLMFLSLITVNIVIGIGWLIEMKYILLLMNNIISIIFLIIFPNYPTMAILFSLVPYGMNSIYILTKEISQTVKSLEVIETKGDIILEAQISQFKDFVSLLINRIEARYPSRYMHSLNVAEISEGISRELNLEERVINTIKEGAIIHDIGFLGIDHRKLSKEKPYEEDEEIIKHIWIGRNILEKSNIFIKYLPFVLYHHERLDGSGPEGLKGNIIPLPAKIVAVADKFERLINGRDSQKLSVKEALNFIKKYSGKFYDPMVVNALERYVQKHFNY